MSRVWEHSTHSGSELLMLLAISDFADDDGRAYPSVQTLATKCRMSARNANHLLARLRDSGELEIRLGQGPRGTNAYRVRFGPDGAKPLKPASPPEGLFTHEAHVTPEGPVTLKPVAPTPEAGSSNPLKPASPKPSLNHQEPSQEAATPPQGVPACPQRQLIAMFTEKVPELPKPRAEFWVGSNGAEAMAARWKFVLTAKRENGARYATNEAEAIEWFGFFFDAVAASDFLTGRNGKPGRFDLSWLMKKENFMKVVQGNYANRETA
jgi:Helix-turn-helix domain